MTTGGKGIPRLQELSYLEVIALSVSEGATFEDIRLRLIDHMEAMGAASPGTGNATVFRTAKSNPKRYVLNVTEGLKELMRLGLLHKAILPSSASSAHAYKATTFVLTGDGSDWAELLRSDRRDAYDYLFQLLAEQHPQFIGFLGVVGATGESQGLTIPLLRWGESPAPRSRANYMGSLTARVTKALQAGALGWQASPEEVESALRAYVQSIIDRAVAREKPDPFAKNQDLVRSCEEALVKLAFKNAGVPLDYISMEILRRWTRTLGLSNFSYHAPGPYALRLWPTASITRGSDHFEVARRVGPEWRDRVVDELRNAYEEIRRSDRTGSPWIPVFKVRAAVCARLQIADSEFDIALLEFLRGERGKDATFGINLDPASYGSIPPSERPLVVSTQAGVRIFKSMSLVQRTNHQLEGSNS
jgi:hypothetical protein